MGFMSLLIGARSARRLVDERRYQMPCLEEAVKICLILTDVCDFLQLGNSRMVSERLDNDEKGVSQIDTP